MARAPIEFSRLQLASVAFGAGFVGVLTGFLFFPPVAIYIYVKEFQTMVVGGIAFILGIWGFIETRRRDERLHDKERRALMAAYAAEFSSRVGGMERTYWLLQFWMMPNIDADTDLKRSRENLKPPATVKIIDETTVQIGILGPDLAGYVVDCSSRISDIYSAIQTVPVPFDQTFLRSFKSVGEMALTLARKLSAESGGTKMSIQEKFPKASDFEEYLATMGPNEFDEDHPD